jgi:hypothetical protein
MGFAMNKEEAVNKVKENQLINHVKNRLEEIDEIKDNDFMRASKIVEVVKEYFVEPVEAKKSQD